MKGSKKANNLIYTIVYLILTYMLVRGKSSNAIVKTEHCKRKRRSFLLPSIQMTRLIIYTKYDETETTSGEKYESKDVIKTYNISIPMCIKWELSLIEICW